MDFNIYFYNCSPSCIDVPFETSVLVHSRSCVSITKAYVRLAMLSLDNFVVFYLKGQLTKLAFSQTSQFLAPLAKGQQAIVMALCPSCVRPLSVHPCVRKPFLQKTFPQKLLTGFLRKFTGMFLRWSSFKFLQIIVFFEEFWLPW